MLRHCPEHNFNIGQSKIPTFPGAVMVSAIRPLGRVVKEDYTDEGTELTIVIGNADRDRLVAKHGRGIIKE